MPLDDQFGEIRELKIDKDNSEMLHVHDGYWKEELFKMERRTNLGCVVLIIMIWIGLNLMQQQLGLLTMLIIVVSIFIKILNAKRANNLVVHGFYKFEISPDKIVRYASSEYDIFYFKNIKEIKEKPFGLILRKEKTFLDYLNCSVYRNQRKTQMVIPNQLYAYNQVKKFLEENAMN